MPYWHPFVHALLLGLSIYIIVTTVLWWMVVFMSIAGTFWAVRFAQSVQYYRNGYTDIYTNGNRLYRSDM